MTWIWVGDVAFGGEEGTWRRVPVHVGNRL